MEREKLDAIISLIKREVVPAMGCTEPVAVALCVAKAAELIGTVPESIDISLSGNIIKNAMGVGIPGTGMVGLPIAVALGALIGKSEYGLEVLKDVAPDSLTNARQYVDENHINITHMPDAPSKLHIEVCAKGGGNFAKTVISESHQNFIYIEKNGEKLLDKGCCAAVEEEDNAIRLNARTVYDFATKAPLDDIRFILEAKRLNQAAADEGLSGKYGHKLGYTLMAGPKLIGISPMERMMALTSSACDARMGGATVPVMSNSGSGNQGITCTMPVVSYANDINATEEQTIRALILSHLTSIYIKQSLGRLSALCGCVVASTGASSGLVYLMGGGFEQICAAIKNMVANLTGMICDGAKPSCSMKISCGVSTAAMSAMLAMEGRCVSSEEGIIDDDIDKTISNLTIIGSEAMLETDKLVLKIMVNK